MTRTVQRRIGLQIFCPILAEEFMQMLNGALSCVPDEYRSSATIDIDNSDNDISIISLRYNEPETEEEAKNRLLKDERRIRIAMDFCENELVKLHDEYKSIKTLINNQ